MATEQPTETTPPSDQAVHPGDIIQDSTGFLMLVTQTKSWGVGAVHRWHDGVEEQERYHRLKTGQFVVCGTARTLPEAVSAARRDSLKTAALLEREAQS